MRSRLIISVWGRVINSDGQKFGKLKIRTEKNSDSKKFGIKIFGRGKIRNHKIRIAENSDEQKFGTKSIRTNENSESQISER